MTPAKTSSRAVSAAERPDWACRTLAALRDAMLYGRGEDRLTEAEQTLLRAVDYRLSHRLGETSEGLSTDLHTLGTKMIRLAAKEIADEGASTARESHREGTP